MEEGQETRDSVWIIASQDTDGVRGPRERIAKKVEIGIDELAVATKAFVERMGHVINDTPSSVGQYELAEVEVSAEVTTKGQLVLCGLGGEVGVGGGLKFTFKKNRISSTSNDPD